MKKLPLTPYLLVKITLLVLFFLPTNTFLIAQCDNITEGGSIDGDEIGCANPEFDPAPIISLAPATGGSGEIEYMWMRTNGNPSAPFNTWQVIVGATGETYDPGPITETTYYGRCSRRAGCEEFVGESNFVAKVVNCCDTSSPITPQDASVCSNTPVNFSLPTNQNYTDIQWTASAGSFDDPTATSPNYTMMMPGTYDISVSYIDEDCRGFSTTTITITSSLDLNTSVVHAGCGRESGQAVVTPAGGSPEYTYQWSDPANQQTDTAYNLTPGTYTVTVTDAVGCSGVATATIEQSMDLAVSMESQNMLCPDLPSGMVTAVVQNGTAPFSYQWNNSLPDQATQNGLIVGLYMVTVTDAEGCTGTAEAKVSAPDTLKVDVLEDAPTCDDNDGRIRLEPYGGTPPYSYQWGNPVTDNQAVISALSSGTYDYTITDDNGCMLNGLVTINKPDTCRDCTISGGIISTNDPTSLCINDGLHDNITVTVMQNTGTFSQWVITSMDGTIIGLPNGNTIDFENAEPVLCQIWHLSYQEGIENLETGRNVAELAGCFSFSNNIPVQKYEPVFSDILTVENNSSFCAGTSITLSASVIESNLIYEWSATGGTLSDPNTQQTSFFAENVGDYDVTLTIFNGACSTDTTITLSVLPAPQANITSTPASCATGTDGTITSSVSGGVPPYSFTWSPELPNQGNHTGLAPGIYNYTIADANGCSVVSAVEVENEDGISLQLDIEDTGCDGVASGRIAATVINGTPPYTYNWSNDAGNVSILNNLEPGNYGLTVTDANGCTGMETGTINNGAEINIEFATTNPVCAGQDNGSVTATITGAAEPFAIQWSNGSGNIDNITNLSPGSYTITVTDVNGCTKTATTTLSYSSDLAVSLTPVDASCADVNDGMLTAQVSGGTGTITYTWSNGGLNQNTLTNLPAGDYSVTVVDESGCSASNTATINQGAALALNFNTIPASCNGGEDGQVTVNIAGGTAPYAYLWSNGSTASSLTNLPAGNIAVTVTDANGCSNSGTTTIPGSGDLTVDIYNNPSSPVCAGTAVPLSTEINTAGVSFLWTASGGMFSSTASANTEFIMNTPGVYEVVVLISKDGCTASDTVTIEITTPPVVNISRDNISCNGETDGEIRVDVTLGTPPFIYQWTNNISDTSIASNLLAGNYGITVTDQNGCTSTGAATISEPDALVLLLNKTDVTCRGEGTGSITATVLGGTPPYTYNWSTGETGTNTISNLTLGTYNVVVTDANGCFIGEQTVIEETNPLTAMITSNNNDCSQNGLAYVTASGGIPPYSYQWNDATTQNQDTAYNLAPGNYDVTVTDNAGCEVVESVEIIAQNSLLCSIEITKDIISLNGNQGALTATATGGTGTLSYQWNTGSTGNVLTDLTANTYSVTVTDESECSCTSSIDLLNPAKLGDFVFEDIDSNGVQNTGEAGLGGVQVSLTGTNYHGQMVNLVTQSDATGMYMFLTPPGTYKITVLDNLGLTYSPPNQGGDDALDSDINPDMGMSELVTLEENEVNLTLDIGLYSVDGLPCQNVLTGGRVEADEVLCGTNPDPEIITNVRFPSGGVGTLEYLWLSSHKSTYFPGDPDWIEIPNSNSADYDPGPITQTTYYIRCARRKGCDNYPGESNIISKVVNGDCESRPTADNLRLSNKDGMIELVWEGMIPSDDGAFIIEKSMDGELFSVIGTMESHYSTHMREYHYMDQTPAYGENYYRIRTFHPTEKYVLSNVAMLMRKDSDKQKLAIYPNPAQEAITIHFLEELDEMAVLQLVSGYGQIIQQLEIDTRQKRYQLDVSELAPGMYFLKFDNRKLKLYSEKFYKAER